MTNTVTVLVAAPLCDRDAKLIAGWATAVRSVAETHRDKVFCLRAAVWHDDNNTIRACNEAKVEIVAIHRPAVPDDGRGRYIAIALKRIRLVREAQKLNAAVVWFINANVRVLPGHWEAIDTMFRVDHPAAVVVPYPIRWAGGAPAVCVNIDDKLCIHDSRQFTSLSGSTSALVYAGGMGCTAILTPVAALVKFDTISVTVMDAAGARTVTGEDIGWFQNAQKAGVQVRMPLDMVAELAKSVGPVVG